MMGDRAKHAAHGVAGKAKEAAGKVTGNDRLAARGRAEQAKADVEKAADKVGDAAKDVVRK